jgi:hypothetical protein
MPSASTLVEVSDLRSFFFQSLCDAIDRQGVDAREGTLPYLAGMLTDYARSERLFDRTADGTVRTPLALLYKAAVESESPRERSLFLRRLGDAALFIAGLFSESLSRSPVDVDYYIAMGGGAYASLSHMPREGARERALSDVFDDLASNFASFVDVLGQVGEQTREDLQDDVLRLHELWHRTGSRRIERRLRALGVVPQRHFPAH